MTINDSYNIHKKIACIFPRFKSKYLCRKGIHNYRLKSKTTRMLPTVEFIETKAGSFCLHYGGANLSIGNVLVVEMFKNLEKKGERILMKRMQIIKLYNRVAKGRKVPRLISYWLYDGTFEWNEEECAYFNSIDKETFSVPMHHFNDFVEIIED